jgi:hypothetical protein
VAPQPSRDSSAVALRRRVRFFEVVDVSNPASPIVIGGLDLGGIDDIAVAGNYAYVVTYSVFHVLDLSDPTSPVISGSLDVGGGTGGVAASDGYAYVADGHGGFQVVDVSNPYSPSIVGGRINGLMDVPGNARGVSVSGDYVHVANNWGSHRVLPAQCDVAVPAPLTLPATGIRLKFAS